MAAGQTKSRLAYSYKSLVWLLIGGSVGALLLAYISQYGFGLEPCKLCLYQRIPYALIAVLSIIALWLARPLQRWVVLLCIILLVLEAALAFFHTAVEQGITSFDVGCADSMALEEIDDIEALKEQLLQTQAVPCDQPAFVFLGLSMAAWNGVFALVFALVMGILWWKRK